MATSQNGWAILSESETRRVVIPGTDITFLLRDGAAGFLLACLILWFIETIEPLTRSGPNDDHGWGQRFIGSTDVPSNHWSGTAVDLNALAHRQGIRDDGFTPTQVKVIRRRCAIAFLGLVKWGNDFRAVPDAMHFEINGSEFAVKALARVLAFTGRGKRIRAANPGMGVAGRAA